MSGESRSDDLEWAGVRRPIVEAATKLTVLPSEDTPGELTIDATALMSNENQVSHWMLYHDEAGLWSAYFTGEPPCPLSEVLQAIAACYVDVDDPELAS